MTTDNIYTNLMNSLFKLFFNFSIFVKCVRKIVLLENYVLSKIKEYMKEKKGKIE